MAKLIRCECGFVAQGDRDDQVVGAIRGHMAADHPALLVTGDDRVRVLAIAQHSARVTRR